MSSVGVRVVLVSPLMGDACSSLGGLCGPPLSFGGISRVIWFGLVRFYYVWFCLVLPVMQNACPVALSLSYRRWNMASI